MQFLFIEDVFIQGFLSIKFLNKKESTPDELHLNAY